MDCAKIEKLMLRNRPDELVQEIRLYKREGRFKSLLNDHNFGGGTYTFLQQLVKVSSPHTVIDVIKYIQDNLNDEYFER